MLTQEGWLAEGIVSNLFFVRDKRIYTPSIDTGILPGITRGRVIEIAHEAGYVTAEGRYTWDELLTAEEVWVTNSIQELVPVTALRDRSGHISRVGSGTVGPIVRELLVNYREKAISGVDS